MKYIKDYCIFMVVLLFPVIGLTEDNGAAGGPISNSGGEMLADNAELLDNINVGSSANMDENFRNCVLEKNSWEICDEKSWSTAANVANDITYSWWPKISGNSNGSHEVSIGAPTATELLGR